MPKKKGVGLEEALTSFLTLEEASAWIEGHQAEFGLAKVPNSETLKKAAQHGRLKAALKGRLYLTREQELRDYLKVFDPKNKTESRPLQPRAQKRRAAKASQDDPETKTSDSGAGGASSKN